MCFFEANVICQSKGVQIYKCCRRDSCNFQHFMQIVKSSNVNPSLAPKDYFFGTRECQYRECFTSCGYAIECDLMENLAKSCVQLIQEPTMSQSWRSSHVLPIWKCLKAPTTSLSPWRRGFLAWRHVTGALWSWTLPRGSSLSRTLISCCGCRCTDQCKWHPCWDTRNPFNKRTNDDWQRET